MPRRSHFALLMAVATIFAILAPPGAEAQRRRRRGVPINIESTPAGAQVFVDSADTPTIGTTPMRSVRVQRGNHTLIFRLANHEEGRLSINVRRRRETFRVVLNALSTIQVSATNEAATGAAVRVDGQPMGNIPYQGTVRPGRHLIQVGREGYVTFSQWATLSGGQVLTLPVTLTAETPETGSILVAGDVSGAAIYVDGAPHGVTPNVLESIPAGQHTVEVRPDDASLTPFRQTVLVIAGERVNLNPSLRPARAAGGSLRVIVRPAGALVSLDGEALGEAPAGREGIAPGEHIIEATAEGYLPGQQPVTIEDGRQKVVSITLQAVELAPGRIVVNSSAAGAVVIVDGEERGSPPVVIENATAGTHAIAVRATGRREYRTTCNVGPGNDCDITATLEAVGTPVRVEANAPNARFLVDGEDVGPVPWEGTLPIGSHRIEVQADGYQGHVEQVALRVSDQTRLFNIALVADGELTPEQREDQVADRRRQRHDAVSRSAGVLPDNMTVLDISVGWPYVADLRLGIGILDFLEAGFGVRTIGVLTEFEGRVKLGWRPIRQVSLGVESRFGGGIGPSRGAGRHEGIIAGGDVSCDPNPTSGAALPGCESAPDHPTNSFFLTLQAMLSLHFNRAGAFSLWVAGDFTSDRWDYTRNDRNSLQLNPSGQPSRSRDNLARMRLGGSLEFVMNRHWNVFVMLDGILAGGDRRILGDILGAGLSDTQLYGRLGFTYKFGLGD